MGTFSGGYMLDPTTGRPVVGAPVAVTDFTTGAPVVPERGSLATGASGGYGRFTVADVDAVTLRAGGVEQIVVSIERQVELARMAGLVVLAVDADGVFYPARPGAGTHVLEQDADGIYYAVAAA